VQPPGEFSLFIVGLPTSSQRMSGHQILQNSIHLTTIVGCNASGISQTLLSAQLDHSGAKESALQQIWLAADRKLLTTFINFWTHAPRPVFDILNIRYELSIDTEMFWLNSVCCFRRNLINCMFQRVIFRHTVKIHARCIVKGENSLGGCA